MTKHTPGPWFKRGLSIELEDGYTIAEVVQQDTHEDHEANARLMAEAPAMRDVLAHFVRIATAFDLKFTGSGGDYLAEAKAVLARIDGGDDWIPASVGCHWTRGDETISTFVQGTLSGYVLTRYRKEVGRYPTLDAAKEAADTTAEGDSTICDECGLSIPPVASTLVNSWHKESCSLHPKNVVHTKCAECDIIDPRGPEDHYGWCSKAKASVAPMATNAKRNARKKATRR